MFLVIYMNFERLKLIRESLEYSQEELAKLLNVSQSTYSRWETGEKIIPFKHLINLCNITKLSVNYTLGITNEKKYFKDDILIDKKIIGENLYQFRKKYGLSQEKLASQINTTHSTISAYENGKVLILTSFVYQIANDYNLSIDWLLGRK